MAEDTDATQKRRRKQSIERDTFQVYMGNDPELKEWLIDKARLEGVKEVQFIKQLLTEIKNKRWESLKAKTINYKNFQNND